MFICISLYLTRVVGFNDIWAGWIGGLFSAGLYFLPPFSGAYADKIGFRRSVILAFALLTLGYFTLGVVSYKPCVLSALVIIMIGGSFIKSIITGTVAKTTKEQTRARGYSIFYAIVNIGAFLGKTIAYPLRISFGVTSINFFSCTVTFLALVLVLFFFKNIDTAGKRKSLRQTWQGFIKVVTNFRLLFLIIIITGFWVIQHQLYATMPKYVLRTAGEGAAPEWIANVNPLTVIVFVIVITQLMGKVKAITSMTIGMFLMPLSALTMSLSPVVESFVGQAISIFGLFSIHPITFVMICGIVIQGLAECFISPRYLEFFSLQAPRGEEGLYLGFSHLHSFLSSVIGFGISGYLLTAYVPDPKTLSPIELASAYEHSYKIWYYFACIGLCSGVSLIIYNWVINAIDKKKHGRV